MKFNTSYSFLLSSCFTIQPPINHTGVPRNAALPVSTPVPAAAHLCGQGPGPLTYCYASPLKPCEEFRNNISNSNIYLHGALRTNPPLPRAPAVEDAKLYHVNLRYCPALDLLFIICLTAFDGFSSH